MNQGVLPNLRNLSPKPSDENVLSPPHRTVKHLVRNQQLVVAPRVVAEEFAPTRVDSGARSPPFAPRDEMSRPAQRWLTHSHLLLRSCTATRVRPGGKENQKSDHRAHRNTPRFLRKPSSTVVNYSLGGTTETSASSWIRPLDALAPHRRGARPSELDRSHVILRSHGESTARSWWLR